MGDRDRLVAVARQWLGTPFRHQGRQPGRGLDCVGLVVCAARHCGLADYDVTDYPRLPQGDALAGHLRAAGLVAVDPRAALPGDVLLMRFTREAQHVALVTDGGILHAHEQVGRVVEHRLDESWRRRIVAVYRFAEVI
jgi:NlpC/P60 family putative phage cell wall peptidase